MLDLFPHPEEARRAVSKDEGKAGAAAASSLITVQGTTAFALKTIIPSFTSIER
jgi:hypothetical protein